MNCFFNNAKCQFLYGPFNGLRGLFKFDLLSSDSFYCQGALKTSFRQEITKRCALRTIAEAIIRAKSQIWAFYGRFSQNARIYERACIYTGGSVTLQCGGSKKGSIFLPFVQRPIRSLCKIF